MCEGLAPASAGCVVTFVKRAVALEYGKLAAPIMTAKGQGEIAELIIEEAKRQGVQCSAMMALQGGD